MMLLSFQNVFFNKHSIPIASPGEVLIKEIVLYNGYKLNFHSIGKRRIKARL